MTKKHTLYQEIIPHQTGKLKVSDLHEIYYEISGNPNGKPVIVCHGGPGGGSTSSMRRYFDPEAYRIILFDQRGCGKSTPNAELRENTTWHLVEDMEKIRETLNINKWQVFGGSWGSTLALTYAQQYPSHVSELVLRGIFTLRQEEILWFYQEGANWIYPDAWENFVKPIPLAERSDMIGAYHKRLISDDLGVRLEAAKAWSVWEGTTVSLMPSLGRMSSFATPEFALAFARIECHYFINKGFFENDDQLIKNIETIQNIPGTIVQGRYDVVTPMKSAWELHKAWKSSELIIVDDAGHAASEPGVVSCLVGATEKYKAH